MHLVQHFRSSKLFAYAEVLQVPTRSILHQWSIQAQAACFHHAAISSQEPMHCDLATLCPFVHLIIAAGLAGEGGGGGGSWPIKAAIFMPMCPISRQEAGCSISAKMAGYGTLPAAFLQWFQMSEGRALQDLKQVAILILESQIRFI